MTRNLLHLAQKALDEVRNLMLATDGVVGLYKNDSVTPWSELLSGVDSRRLAHFKEALAEIDSALLGTDHPVDTVEIEDVENLYIPVGAVTKVSIGGVVVKFGCRERSEAEIENGYGCARLGCVFVSLSLCPECRGEKRPDGTYVAFTRIE